MSVPYIYITRIDSDVKPQWKLYAKAQSVTRTLATIKYDYQNFITVMDLYCPIICAILVLSAHSFQLVATVLFFRKAWNLSFVSTIVSFQYYAIS